EGSAARGRRLSLPLFLHHRPDVILSARHSAGSYLQQRLEELGVVQKNGGPKAPVRMP
ncbi:MAG: hypothetical protein ISQ55_02720, partial [Pseudomonadales bacterium]|nr:hypothetical protein [Pseudomonadales bacterium]